MKKLITILLLSISIQCCCQRDVIGMYTQSLNLNNSVIVFDGNSHFYGYPNNTLTESPPAIFSTLSPFSTNGTTVYNKGINGQVTAAMTYDADTDIDPLYNSSVTSILIALEIENDIFFNGDPTAAYNNMVDYCNDRRAVGWKVLVCTNPFRNYGPTTPAGDDAATYSLKLDTAVALVRANWASFSDGIVDLRANSAFQSYSPTYYVADELHFTVTGNALIATLIRNKILSL